MLERDSDFCCARREFGHRDQCGEQAGRRRQRFDRQRRRDFPLDGALPDCIADFGKRQSGAMSGSPSTAVYSAGRMASGSTQAATLRINDSVPVALLCCRAIRE